MSMTPCTIRGTAREDVPAIFAIWNDPLVLKEQYGPQRGETQEVFATMYLSGRKMRGLDLQCTSIFVDETLVGNVFQCFATWPSGRVCNCGWNLAPSQWGRGIMPAALAMLFDQLFTQERVSSVVADCFSTNGRCLRVLEKLAFQLERLPILDALWHFYRCRGRHRVRRHRLTAERWATRPLVRSS
jgi:RimJ/RimL family protein N-acetyltransferase